MKCLALNGKHDFQLLVTITNTIPNIITIKHEQYVLNNRLERFEIDSVLNVSKIMWSVVELASKPDDNP